MNGNVLRCQECGTEIEQGYYCQDHPTVTKEDMEPRSIDPEAIKQDIKFIHAQLDVLLTVANHVSEKGAGIIKKVYEGISMSADSIESEISQGRE